MTLSVCTLESIAKVSLGFKSLQNHFFYISRETIKEYGIEKKYLRPVFQLGDLDAEKYKQDAEPVQWVFHCKDHEPDLRGTGALKYIRAMERIPAAEKKQGGKKQTIRQAPQDQTSAGGLWYAPKAQLHEMNIWLRKAFNTTYAPFLFDPGAAVDQRCNYLAPLDGIEWHQLAAILTSSLFALSAESFGATSMGAGALELPTTKIQEVKVVDLRGLKDAAAKTDLVRLAQAVWDKTVPVDWGRLDRPPQEVQELDRWLLERMKSTVSLDRLYSDLIRTMRARLAVAEDKDVKTKKNQAVNIAMVVRGIAETVRPLLESQNFPESFMPQGLALQSADFTNSGKLEIESHPMMGENILIVRSGAKTLFEKQLDRSVAQVVIKALLLGRRNFSYPADPEGASAALKEFAKWFPRVLERISEGCSISSVGTGYEERVRAEVLESLHLEPALIAPEFFGSLALRS